MKRSLLVLGAVLAIVLGIAACGGSKQAATGSVHPSGWGGTPKGVTLPAPLYGLAPTQTQTMVDGIGVGDFRGLQPFALAGYTAGLWPDYLPLHAAFPVAHAVSIAISVRYHAACLDDEPGDATPSQAGPWVLADIKAGFPRPCVYADLSNMPAVQASLRAWLGSSWRAHVFLWLAWYRFVPGLVSGYDAVQYTDKCYGRNLDCSTVSLAFLSVAQPPYVAPKPPAPKPPAPTPKPKPPAPKPHPAHQPSKAQVCKVLNAQATWFASELKAHPRVRTAYRKGALASTRRAEKRVGCVVK